VLIILGNVASSSHQSVDYNNFGIEASY